MDPSDGLGERIARYRRLAGISARELAEQAGRGLSRGIIANIESGRKTDITVDQLLAIAIVLGVPPFALALPIESPMRQVKLSNGTKTVSAPVWVASEWLRELGPGQQYVFPTAASGVSRTVLRMIADYLDMLREATAGRVPRSEALRELRQRADELRAAGIDITVERADGEMTADVSEISLQDLHRTWRQAKAGEDDEQGDVRVARIAFGNKASDGEHPATP